MNESALLREQMARERRNVCAVADVWAGLSGDGAPAAHPPGDELGHACLAYLTGVVRSFAERDRRLTAWVDTRLPATDPARTALAAVLARRGTSEEALEMLSAADGAARRPAGGAPTLGALFENWRARGAAIDALLTGHARLCDWRLIAGIDADTILAERRGYARVCSALPPGVRLTPPDESEG